MIRKTEASVFLFTFPKAFSTMRPLFTFPCRNPPPRRSPAPPAENIMSPPNPSISPAPSQAVERIREILVGRQLERIELRISHLENQPLSGNPGGNWNERLCAQEAKTETLQDALQRITRQSDEENQRRETVHREEIQRISNQVQQVAASRTSQTQSEDVARLEQKVGGWLHNWHKAFQEHLNSRDQKLLAGIRSEVAMLWESTEGELTRLRSQAVETTEINERLERVAQAARQLAEAAAPPAAAENPARKSS